MHIYCLPEGLEAGAATPRVNSTDFNNFLAQSSQQSEPSQQSASPADDVDFSSDDDDRREVEAENAANFRWIRTR